MPGQQANRTFGQQPPAFFLRYTGPHQRGLSGHSSLQSAKAVAWDLYREGKLRPVEVLDRHRQVAVSREELRQYLALQDRMWPEIEDLGDDLDFE